METMHDRLVGLIRNCIVKITFEELAGKRHLCVIAVNEEEEDKKFYRELTASGFTGRITFISQPKMVSVLQEWDYRDKEVIEWEGKYTLRLSELLLSSESLKAMDGFVFFSRQGLNLRNKNLTEIAEALTAERDVDIYCIDANNEVYLYRNLDIYHEAVHVYLALNDLADLCFTRGMEVQL